MPFCYRELLSIFIIIFIVTMCCGCSAPFPAKVRGDILEVSEDSIYGIPSYQGIPNERLGFLIINISSDKLLVGLVYKDNDDKWKPTDMAQTMDGSFMKEALKGQVIGHVDDSQIKEWFF